LDNFRLDLFDGYLDQYGGVNFPPFSLAAFEVCAT